MYVPCRLCFTEFECVQTFFKPLIYREEKTTTFPVSNVQDIAVFDKKKKKKEKEKGMKGVSIWKVIFRSKKNL